MPRHQKTHVFQAVLHGLRGRCQRHLKLAALHAQALHGLGDGPGQLRCSLGPGLRDAAGLLLVLPLRRLLGGLQRCQVCGGVQLLQRLAPAVLQGRQFGRVVPVAPRQRHPQRQPLVQLGQALRVQLGAAQVGAQAVHGVLHLRQAGCQNLRQPFEHGLYVLLLL